MRRVLLFAAFLLLLGLTTATAASFDVQAEDITSFPTDVSISLPTTTTTTTPLPPIATEPWYLFRAPPAPGGISTDPESGGPHKWDVKPSDSSTTLLAQAAVDKYYVWSSGTLPSALSFQSQAVTFNVYLTSGGKDIEAALLDCPAGAPLVSSNCTVIGSGQPGTGQGNQVVVELGEITATVGAGRELRLKVVNRDTKNWTVEWGFGSARDSNLAIAPPSP